mmetsp:Transcript_13012/g.40059  ORF Transcript_13012/g.40059 Transcript_13012/m.40059 type:complete len:613 (-) Transcript_13012:1243-3081(-)
MNGIKEIERLIWSGRLQEAEESLAAELHGDNFGGKVTQHRAQLTAAHVPLLRLWIHGDDHDAKELVSRCESAIATAESFLKQSGGSTDHLQSAPELAFDSTDARLVVAQGTLFKAVGQMFLGHGVKGFLSVRLAYKEYGKELARTSATSDDGERGAASLPNVSVVSGLEETVCFGRKSREYLGFDSCWQFGLGFFLLYLSMAPVKLIKILEVVGFAVDRELGVKLLKQGTSSLLQTDPSRISVGSYYCAHALLWHLFDFSFSSFSKSELSGGEGRTLGLSILVALARPCPNSIIWTWLECTLMRLDGKFPEANVRLLAVYEDFCRHNAKAGPIGNGRIACDVQINALLSEDYGTAEVLAEQTVESRGSKRLPIFTYAALGISELLSGKVEKAEETFKEAADVPMLAQLGELESVVASRVKSFPRRVHGQVVYGEFVLSIFASEWLKPDQAERLVPSLQSAIGNLEDRLSEKPTGRLKGKALSKASIFGVFSSESSRLREELEIAYVVCAAMLRISAERGPDRVNHSAVSRATSLAERALSSAQSDRWISVFASYELGLLSILRREYKVAGDYLDLARDNVRGFTAERAVTSRIERARQSIAPATRTVRAQVG